LEEAMTLVEREPFMTKVSEARSFVESTSVDTLAVAVGNIHGVVKMRQGITQALNLDRLHEIHSALPDIPLVLHGASGLNKDQLQAAKENGVLIVNMNTELKLAFVGALRKFLSADSDAFDPRVVLTPSIESLTELVSAKLRELGSTGKANSSS
jgi:fructose-bisphosphate aldolase, class II